MFVGVYMYGIASMCVASLVDRYVWRSSECTVDLLN